MVVFSGRKGFHILLPFAEDWIHYRVTDPLKTQAASARDSNETGVEAHTQRLSYPSRRNTHGLVLTFPELLRQNQNTVKGNN